MDTDEEEERRSRMPRLLRSLFAPCLECGQHDPTFSVAYTTATKLSIVNPETSFTFCHVISNYAKSKTSSMI
ncbi:hypothetical protein E2C01_045668 [Portunus trituberculatus]|uniref:Uncharacterized protein n=1 Tax=Portunus trituberculatus TaxID=210409 RepID=A0A5B7G5N4_PORTR|nr:hypothetical protein [Portunus trituberculatus]